ncbi:hypothetical protein QBC41DRAFT_143954 [Cercophora samala]|uniref:Zn(2)-C6 fungal-type domain-containing protein n=1 Tax=Cercophora samala TaxID=330535 RepID=A0AA39ZLE5_9PEZI|nr:hypothetical protein QBC41DRAFT_143954 [Cercophora samala]
MWQTHMTENGTWEPYPQLALNRSQSPSQVSVASSCTLPLHSPRNEAQTDDQEDPPVLDISPGTRNSIEQPSSGASSRLQPAPCLPPGDLVNSQAPQEVWPDGTGRVHVVPEGVPKPHTRRRLKASCVSCRRRMMRCDGEGPPCGPCEKNGRECVMVPRRHPRNRPFELELLGASHEGALPEEPLMLPSTRLELAAGGSGNCCPAESHGNAYPSNDRRYANSVQELGQDCGDGQVGRQFQEDGGAFGIYRN